MIRIFEEDSNLSGIPPYGTNFNSNGIGALLPSKCTITETLNGEYELELEHPLDDYGKYERLQNGRIIVAPCPSTPDPIYEMTDIEQVREVVNSIDGAPLKNSPSDDAEDSTYKAYNGYKCFLIAIRRNGKTIVYENHFAPDKEEEWRSKMDTAEDGWVCVNFYGSSLENPYNDAFDADRYIKIRYLRPVRKSFGSLFPQGGALPDIANGSTAYLTEQMFRIYKVQKMLNSVKAYAKHISYDAANFQIISFNPSKWFSGVSEYSKSDLAYAMYQYSIMDIGPYSAHWRIYSNYDEIADAPDDYEIKNTNFIDGLLGSNGLVATFGGDIFRNQQDFCYINSLGTDRGVRIRNGKNLKGITYEEDWSELVTMVLPVGKDGRLLDGTSSYQGSLPTEDKLNKYYLQSENADAYKKRYIKLIEYSDAGSVEKLKKAVERDFENGLDKPKISVTVDFLNVEDTVEYEQYKFLQGVFLGDTVHAIANRVNIDVALRVTQYTFNCLTRKYDSITLGEPKKIDLKV